VPATRPSQQDRPARRSSRPIRPAVAGIALLTALLTLAACGGGSKSTGTTGTTGTTASAAAAAQRGTGRRGGFGFAQDPKVRACLQKQGVTLPARGAGRGGPRNGTLPGGANGRPPDTRTGPTGAAGASGPTVTTGSNGRPGGFRRDPAQFAKLQAAMKACGVQMPARRPGSGQAGPYGPQNQPAPSAGTS
jgi:hypothetical protein